MGQQKNDDDGQTGSTLSVEEQINAYVETYERKQGSQQTPPPPPRPVASPVAGELEVLDYVRIAGKDYNRPAIEKHLRDYHAGRRGEEWTMNHPGLNFEAILQAFLDNIDQQKFGQSSYLKSRFGLFSADFLVGKRTLKPQPAAVSAGGKPVVTAKRPQAPTNVR